MNRYVLTALAILGFAAGVAYSHTPQWPDLGGGVAVPSLVAPTKIEKTSTYTVLAAECDGNTYFTNNGAVGTIEFDLPANPTGLICIFVNEEPVIIRVDPNSTDLVLPTAAGKYLQHDGTSFTGGTITLLGIDASTWVSIGIFSTWTAEP